MRILHHGPEHEHCYVFSTILYTPYGWLTFLRRVCIHAEQWNIYVKPFDIAPPPACTPRFTRLIWVLGDRRKTLKPYFSKRANRQITNVSNTISPLSFNRML